MNSEDTNKTDESRNEQENEEYSFLHETVKAPPIDYQKILIKLSMLTGAAILFGVVAALVFYAVLSQRNSTSPNPVLIPSDEQLQQSVYDSVTGGKTQNGEKKTSEEVPDMTAESGSGVSGQDIEGDKDTGTGGEEIPAPVLTEEQLDQNAVDTYMRVGEAFRRIADEAMKSVVTVTGLSPDDEWFEITNVGSRASSGLIVADNSVSYLILTDSISIEDAERIAVTLPDDTVVEADFQKKDPITGLCVVSIPRDRIPGKARNSFSMAVLGNSYQLNQGDPLLAVGAPGGLARSYACGRIISLGDCVEIVDGEYRLVTTDIMGGCPGSGVLVNMAGEVVGMMAGKYTEEEQSGITAIPVSPIKPLIEKLSNNAPISYIGIHGLDISAKAADAQGIPSGVYVSSVDEDSPALQEGIQPGDIITSVGLGSAVTLRSLHDNIMSRSPGDTVDVTVMRPGHSGYAEFAFTLTIGELPEKLYAEVTAVKSQDAGTEKNSGDADEKAADGTDQEPQNSDGAEKVSEDKSAGTEEKASEE